MSSFALAQVSAVTRSSMRVAIIHNHPIHYKELLFRALAAKGLDFEVLYTAKSSVERRDPPGLVRPYAHRFGHSGNYEETNPVKVAHYVWKSLDQIDPDVLIISGYYDPAAWTAWTWALAHQRVRLLWAESNYFDYPRKFYKELPKRIFVRRCHYAHVYGTSNREYLQRLGMDPGRIRIKRAVLDVNRFTPDPSVKKTGPLRLLYVGRFEDMKNLPRLLKAFSSVDQDPANPRLELALVGYGRLEAELKSLAATLPNSSLIRFLGSRTNDQTVDEYRAADCFILPSTREAWGLVALEAMCCGLPVIISERCGCAKDVVQPETGWCFDPFDASDLTAKLEQVSRTPRSRLAEMGAAGRRLAGSYSPESCAEVILDTLLQARAQ
ncbi:MAG TPA: glycosyltransferase family 4 protein [Bryobacteraceae bacterium]|nr:glycosyltransferase family 4 protein [Bryobacteraceae bacterium]